jgi:hypothetical protein
LMRSASATDVPPNFITTVSVPLIGMAANDSRALRKHRAWPGAQILSPAG